MGKACRRVEKSDAAELRELIEKMAELALEARVVGLAAPQVGVFLHVAIAFVAWGKM